MQRPELETKGAIRPLHCIPARATHREGKGQGGGSTGALNSSRGGRREARVTTEAMLGFRWEESREGEGEGAHERAGREKSEVLILDARVCQLATFVASSVPSRAESAIDSGRWHARELGSFFLLYFPFCCIIPLPLFFARG